MKNKPKTEDRKHEDRPYVGVQLSPEERAKIGRIAAEAGRSVAGQLRWIIRQLPEVTS